MKTVEIWREEVDSSAVEHRGWGVERTVTASTSRRTGHRAWRHFLCYIHGPPPTQQCSHWFSTNAAGGHFLHKIVSENSCFWTLTKTIIVERWQVVCLNGIRDMQSLSAAWVYHKIKTPSTDFLKLAVVLKSCMTITQTKIEILIWEPWILYEWATDTQTKDDLWATQPWN